MKRNHQFERKQFVWNSAQHLVGKFKSCQMFQSSFAKKALRYRKSTASEGVSEGPRKNLSFCCCRCGFKLDVVFCAASSSNHINVQYL